MKDPFASEEATAQEGAEGAYHMPGVLHFLQQQWCQYDRDRLKWKVDKTDLVGRIAQLEGEKKAYEANQYDLLRRIKMLEYALKSERNKNTTKTDQKIPLPTFTPKAPSIEVVERKKEYLSSRDLIKSYLNELNFTDEIIESHAERIRANFNIENSFANAFKPNHCVLQPNPQQQSREEQQTQSQPSPEQSSKSQSIQPQQAQAQYKPTSDKLQTLPSLSTPPASMDTNDMPEFDFLGGDMGTIKPPTEDTTKQTPDDDAMTAAIMSKYKNGSKRGKKKMNKKSSSMPSFEAQEQMTEIDNNLTIEKAQKMVDGKSKWKIKYTLRSHYDSIRTVAFHKTAPILVSCSEDCTVKAWSLSTLNHLHIGKSNKTSQSPDFEPLITYRGHKGPVLDVCISSTYNACFSGGSDGTIRAWKLPSENDKPYTSYDPSVCLGVINGHSDCIWKLKVHDTLPILVSTSTDGTVKLWSVEELLDDDDDMDLTQKCLLGELQGKTEYGTPVGVSFVGSDPNTVVVGYEFGQMVLFDIETKTVIREFEPKGVVTETSNRIFSIVSTTAQPLVIAAYEDAHFRIFNLETGKCSNEVFAHTSSVMHLGLDPFELYIVTCSHDRSVRFWDLSTGSCIQEITAHREKFAESIHSVAFHPTKKFVASSGADASIKVYVLS